MKTSKHGLAEFDGLDAIDRLEKGKLYCIDLGPDE